MSLVIRRTAFATFFCAGLLTAAACEDAADPAGFLAAPEAVAALEVPGALPTLPGLIDRALGTATAVAPPAAVEPARAAAAASLAAAQDGEAVGAPASRSLEVLERARALWLQADSATTDPGPAEAWRREARELSAAWLALVLPAGALAEAIGELDRWLQLAGGTLQGRGVAELDEALAAARNLLGESRARAAAGDDPKAVLLFLEACDQAADLTPRRVALRMAAQAEALVVAARSAAEPPAQAAAPLSADGLRLQRAERLARGAREALQRGDQVTALRRAYYARQLMLAR